MNSSVYLFGNLSSGYTQYPDEDYSADLFHKFYQRAKATTQIAVHREGPLMYYCYIRKLEHSQYIGLCILLNDAMITSFGNMFSLFENTINNLAEKGYLICYNDYGNLIANAGKLFQKTEEVESLTASLKIGFEKLANTARKLPPENYSVSKDSTKDFTVDDSAKDILQSSYTNGFTYVYKNKDFNTVQMTNYKGVLSRISGERDKYAKQLAEKKKEIQQLRTKQRNMVWVGVLGVVILVLGVIIWNKVLFPSEVTHYETGEFVYYGPVKNKKPHGEGVAFYPKDDKDGRRYYIGYFVNGERQDTTAMLYYQNGDYFYGSMDGDKFLKGIFYSNSDQSHFEGSFVDNKPCDGTWYNHEESYKMKDGQMK